jgi:hypothetical protein
MIKRFHEYINENIDSIDKIDTSNLMGQSFGSEIRYVIPEGEKLGTPDAFGREAVSKDVVIINKEGIKYLIDKSNFSKEQIEEFEKTLKNFQESDIDWS